MNLTNEQKRKLDAIIAERVEGFEVCNCDEIEGYYPTQRLGISLKYKDVSHYTTDIAAAFELAEHVDLYSRYIFDKMDGKFRVLKAEYTVLNSINFDIVSEASTTPSNITCYSKSYSWQRRI